MDTKCPNCGSSRTKSRVAVFEAGTRVSQRSTWSVYRRLGYSISTYTSQSLLVQRVAPGRVSKSQPTPEWNPSVGFIFTVMILFIAGVVLFPFGHFIIGSTLIFLALVALSGSVPQQPDGYKTEWVCMRCGTMFTPSGYPEQPAAPVGEPESPAASGAAGKPEETDGTAQVASTASGSDARTKQCIVCGHDKPLSEFEYGGRENNSYCSECKDILATIYSTQGKIAAQAYRERVRATWQQP